MSNTPFFRPWGQLLWLLGKSTSRKWVLLGALNTEERCLAVRNCLHGANVLLGERFVRIENPKSTFKTIADSMLVTREQVFLSVGGRRSDIFAHRLSEPYGKILDFVDNSLQFSSESVILDVSSMPKRFFFPILKRLVMSKGTKDILVTYTVPEKYTKEPLAQNCDDWAHIPTFSGEYTRDKPEMLIVNVGFAPMGLPRELTVESTPPIKLLFPFPAPPKSVERAWGFVQKLKKGRSAQSFELYRVDAKEVSDAFDRLVSLTKNATAKAILAPFGPKPISVAMCLFACKTDCEVFYTQPTLYHPEYSSGVSARNGTPDIYGYWIRKDGQDLYSLPNPS